jgi:hypothetical protein
MHQLCLQHGHCGGRVHVRDLLPEAGAISAEEFASLILRAEEIEATYSPERYAEQHQLISGLFRQHMQAEQVEAVDLT